MDANEIENEIRSLEQFHDRLDLVFRLNGILSLAINPIAIYLIVCRSPKQMGAYKWYLLNIVAWSATFDLTLGLLYAPICPLPALGFCARGPLARFDQLVVVCTFLWLFGAIGASLLSAFVYRMAAFRGSTDWLHRPLALVAIALMHVAFQMPPIIVGFYAGRVYEEPMAAYAKQHFPAAYEYGRRHSCFFVTFTVVPNWITYLGLFLTDLEIFSVGLASVYAVYTILRTTTSNRSVMTSRTWALNRQLSIALLIQLTIPGITLIAPMVLLLTLVFFDKADVRPFRSLEVFVTVMMGTHSILNSLATILMIRPYREAFVDGLLRIACLGRARTRVDDRKPSFTAPQSVASEAATIRTAATASRRPTFGRLNARLFRHS